MKDPLNFFTLTLSLFIILSSYAQIPVFLSLLSNFDAKKQRKIIIREMIFAFFILLFFILFGIKVLNVIGIEEQVIGIAGGFLLVIIALSMIFPKESSSVNKGLPQHEPFIVPLAIPCVAGPGAITSVMIFAQQEGILVASLALSLAWGLSALILLSSSLIKNYLGEKGLIAVERLGGMLIFLIGVQMSFLGIINLIKKVY